MRMHGPILPQTPLPSRLPHNTEAEFPVLYSRSLLAIHFKYISVYVWNLEKMGYLMCFAKQKQI